jgi:hypothetical protein
VANNKRDPAAEIPLMAQLFPKLAEQRRMEDFQTGKDQIALNQDSAWSAIKLTPQLAEAERKATSNQRTDDVRDLRRLGPGIMAELRRDNPGWASALAGVNERVQAVRGGGGHTPLLDHLNDDAIGAGPSDLRRMLTKTATDNLALGGGLSAEDERLAQQSARGAWADRGLGASDPALIDEVLNRDSLSRARLAERQAAAGAALTGGINEDAANRDYAVNVEGLNQRNQSENDTLLTNAVNVNQNAIEPMLAFLRPRAAIGPANAAAVLGAGPQTMQSSGGLLQILLGYGQDAANSNFNAIESRANARANNGAAIGAAAVGAGAKVAGSGV